MSRRLLLVVLAGVLALGGLVVAVVVAADDDPLETSGRRYVALGDSYTAAPGVPETLPADGCQRSTGNYPTIVARELDFEEFEDRSCGGASTDDMLAPQTSQVDPQLAAVDEDTDVVTLGIGGNDFDLYGSLMVSCIGMRRSDPDGAPCSSTPGARSLSDAVPQIADQVAAVVEEVEDRAPEARVLVIGYPVIVDEATLCPDRLPLAEDDHVFVARLLESLDRATREEVGGTGATYVDVRSATRGHDICAPDPWINDITNDPNAAILHPFAAEQRAVAELVLAELR